MSTSLNNFFYDVIDTRLYNLVFGETSSLNQWKRDVNLNCLKFALPACRDLSMQGMIYHYNILA